MANKSRNLMSLARRQGFSHRLHGGATTVVWPSQFSVGGTIRTSDDDENNHHAQLMMRGLPQIRSYHSTASHDRAVAIMLGLGTIAAVSYSAAQGVKAYNEWKDSLPDEPPEEESTTNKAEDQKQQEKEKAEPRKAKDRKKEKRDNIFKEWFGVGVGAKYYEGGFEEQMTRREAALILGVRESSSTSRIKDAHRKLLILNHPDTGGSTYMAGKLNEAKELLLKGKRA